MAAEQPGCCPVTIATVDASANRLQLFSQRWARRAAELRGARAQRSALPRMPLRSSDRSVQTRKMRIRRRTRERRE